MLDGLKAHHLIQAASHLLHTLLGHSRQPAPLLRLLLAAGACRAARLQQPRAGAAALRAKEPASCRSLLPLLLLLPCVPRALCIV